MCGDLEHKAGCAGRRRSLLPETGSSERDPLAGRVAAPAAGPHQRVPERVAVAAVQQEFNGEVKIKGKLENVRQALIQLLIHSHVWQQSVQKLKHSEGCSEDDVHDDHDDEQTGDVQFFGDSAVQHVARAVVQRQAASRVHALAHSLDQHDHHEQQHWVWQKDSDADGVPEVHDLVLGGVRSLRRLGQRQRSVRSVVKSLGDGVLPELR